MPSKRAYEALLAVDMAQHVTTRAVVPVWVAFLPPLVELKRAWDMLGHAGLVSVSRSTMLPELISLHTSLALIHESSTPPSL